MSTPLYDALLAHAARHPAPFHMPGHKGRLETTGGLSSALDLTELSDTGDLYAPGEPPGDVIAQAAALWATVWGVPTCRLLTGGATQGLHTALLLGARRGGAVLLERGCHRAVYHALALFDLRPSYLWRSPLEPLSPAALDEALGREPEVKTVCITSPNYYGMLSDVAALAEVAHAHGARLTVDAAHGCHLPFYALQPLGAADLVVASGHKTLPVLGQGAMLLAGAGISPDEVRQAAAVVGTSSPSYLVLASLDLAREWALSPAGAAALAQAGAWSAALRERYGSLTAPGVPVDPLHVALRVEDAPAAGAVLEGRGVWPELVGRDHMVFLLSGHNTQTDLDRLTAALDEVGVTPAATAATVAPPPPPEVAVTPARALRAPRRRVKLAQAEGCVSGQSIAPYPPGVPVIAMGERITKKGLAYLAQVGYNEEQEIEVLV